MKDLTPAEMEIQMAFPDMLKMTVEFEVVFSKKEVEEKGREIATSLQTYLLRYEHHARSAKFYFSEEAKNIVINMKEGQKVELVQRDVAGNIIPSLCKTGTLHGLNQVVSVGYISGDACVTVNLNGSIDMYAIYCLNFGNQRPLNKQEQKGGKA